MSRIEVTFACGCSLSLDEAESGSAEPHCVEHNCYVVSRVKAPPPKFRGSPGVTGPLVEELK
ncbi:MAG TPA: hypothetical protein VN903_23030 [Polyangia bacterium]|nr:hypothetical protein [Polyangia bacterium]